LLYVTYRVALEASETGEWWMPLISGILAVGTLMFRPSDIKVGPQGVEEISLLGLRRRTVSWKGASASFIPGLREVLLIGSDGTTIRHSQYHVGQSEFLSELKSHKVFLQ